MAERLGLPCPVLSDESLEFTQALGLPTFDESFRSQIIELPAWPTRSAAVEIRMKRRGQQGEVAIAFGSFDELSGLIERLRGRSSV